MTSAVSTIPTNCFQPWFFELDKNGRIYHDAHPRPYSYPSSVESLEDQRRTRGTLALIGRNPEGRCVIVECISIKTCVSFRLPPVHHVTHPYPSTDKRHAKPETFEELKKERAILCMQPWLDYYEEIAEFLCHMAGFKKDKIDRHVTVQLTPSIEMYGYCGAEQDAFLDFFIDDHHMANRLAQFYDAHDVIFPCGPVQTPQSLKFVERNYNPITKYLYDTFGQPMPWIRLPSISALEQAGGEIVSNDSNADILIRIHAEQVAKLFKVMTDEERKLLPNQQAPLREMSMDIEMYMEEGFNATKPNAWIQCVAFTLKKLNPATFRYKYESRVFVFCPLLLELPEKFQNIEVRNPILVEMLRKAGYTGELPSRKNAGRRPTRVRCDYDENGLVKEGNHGWADVFYYSSEQEELSAIFDWVGDSQPDLIIGHNHTGFDMNALILRSERYPGLYDRLCRWGKYKWWKGLDKKISKQSGARSMNDRHIIEYPGVLYMDTEDIARENVTEKFDGYKLDEVSKKTLKKQKIEQEFEVSNYLWFCGHFDHYLEYVTKDSTLTLELVNCPKWVQVPKVMAFCQLGFAIPKLILGSMQQARLSARIFIECQKNNIKYCTRDFEGFRSLEDAQQEIHRIAQEYKVISLADILYHPEVTSLLRPSENGFMSFAEIKERADRLEALDVEWSKYDTHHSDTSFHEKPVPANHNHTTNQNPTNQNPTNQNRKKRRRRQLLVNAYDLPLWELRRMIENTPDNPRGKGGLVQEPQTGKWICVCVGDVNAMYPTIIIIKLLSPGNIVVEIRYSNLPGIDEQRIVIHEDDMEFDFIVNVISNLGGIYVKIIKDFLAARKEYKKEMARYKAECEMLEKKIDEARGMHLAPELIEALLRAQAEAARFYAAEQAVKVFSNSLYGFCMVDKSSGMCPLYLIGSAITFVGRSIIRGIRDRCVEKGFKIVYGDSVVGNTTLIVRIRGVICTMRIDELVEEGEWKPYGFGSDHGRYHNGGDHDKECAMISGLEVWQDGGFTTVRRVIRHQCRKPIVRVVTGRGMVDCTTDHSLVRSNRSKASPSVCQLGDSLLHVSHQDVEELIQTMQNVAPMAPIKSTDAFELGLVAVNPKSKLPPNWYNAHGERRIPHEMLTAPLEIAQQFWNGYFFDSFDTTIVKNKEWMTGLWMMANRLGYLEYLGCSDSSDSSDASHHNDITMIHPIHDIDDHHVYDLETDSHHFHVGPGALVVHNTDSVMIIHIKNMKAMMDEYRKVEALDPRDPDFETKTNACITELTRLYCETVNLAETIFEEVSKKYNIVFELEKVYLLFIVLMAKMYIAVQASASFRGPCPTIGQIKEDVNKKENKRFELITKGVRVARRDTCKAAATILKNSIYPASIFGGSPQEIMESVADNVIQLWMGKFGMKECTQSQTLTQNLPYHVGPNTKLRADDFYKDDKKPTHALVAEREYKRNPTQPIAKGNKVEYLYVNPKYIPGSTRDLKSGRAVSMMEAMEKNWKPDYADVLQAVAAESIHLLTAISIQTDIDEVDMTPEEKLAEEKRKKDEKDELEHKWKIRFDVFIEALKNYPYEGDKKDMMSLKVAEIERSQKKIEEGKARLELLKEYKLKIAAESGENGGNGRNDVGMFGTLEEIEEEERKIPIEIKRAEECMKNARHWVHVYGLQITKVATEKIQQIKQRSINSNKRRREEEEENKQAARRTEQKIRHTQQLKTVTQQLHR